MSCRVRFAPSPTGFLHIGNARVAIVNCLFALKSSGSFLLRIDDTDITRSKKEYEDSIMNDLIWLGIKYDRFCRQSERIDRYHEVMKSLVKDGIVYRCFETAEELEYKKRRALSEGVSPVYDRASLFLDQAEARSLEEGGARCHWRFKLPDECISWNDIILGNVSYDLRNISDPVIMKTDGSFLYTFTSVIDDIDYEVTHVIRGQDHVTNTSAQIAMFRAISRGHPEFAHLSLLVDKDGSQFSKRLGGMNLSDIRGRGIDPMAVLNLLATLGSSLAPLYTLNMDDLIDYFDINKFSTNSPKFDMNNLFLLNRKILQSMTYDDVKDRVGQDIEMPPNSFEMIRDNIMTYEDIKEWDRILSHDFIPQPPSSEDEKNVLKGAVDALERVELDCLVRTVKEETGISGKALYIPLRKAITGMEHGPNLEVLLRTIGKREVERRIGQCLDL
jgi:glutamyl-tRNA synthetase